MTSKYKIILSIVVAVIILAFVKDAIIKFSVEKAVKLTTGLEVRIDSLRVGFLTKQVVDIKGLKVFNPGGYTDRIMVEIPRVYVDYNLKTALGKKIQIYDMELNLKEFVVVKNKDGKSNLEEIKLPKSESPKDLSVDNFHLKIAKVLFKDYSRSPATTQEFTLNIDEKFHNVDNLNALVRVVLTRSIADTAIKNFVNYDVNTLKDSVAGILADSERMVGSKVGQALEQAADKLKSLFGK